MKRYFVPLIIGLCFSVSLNAQEEDDEPKKGFQKERLFTGGSISLAFFNNTFLIGGSPVLGYNIARWIDAGIVANYSYSSQRDPYGSGEKLRQSVYGGGVFTKIYPVRFLFAQGQLEYNIVRLKFIPDGGGSATVQKTNATSYLVGGGYTTSRDPDGGSPFFYLAVLFDLSKNVNSPYTDQFGRAIPIIRGGVQIPLFSRRPG